MRQGVQEKIHPLMYRAEMIGAFSLANRSNDQSFKRERTDRSARKKGGRVQGAGITLTRLTIGVSGPLALPRRRPGCRSLRRGFHQRFQQLVVAVSQVAVCVFVAQQWA